MIIQDVIRQEEVLQESFYKNLGVSVESVNNNDGVYKGCLFENKLKILDINEVLFQMIKYASKLRIRGLKLPYYLIGNDLTEEKIYIFNSDDFLADIEKIYIGASSKNNKGFINFKKPLEISYKDLKGKRELFDILETEKYTKYHVDFNNILGLANEYYKVNDNKDKLLDINGGEIRNPNVLADRILPYKKKDNLEFSILMDCLNPARLQANLGAYYTPKQYVELSQKMLLERIDKISKLGLDYIVLDRAAGVGNLFEGLPDEVLSHCVLSTIEPNEYLILQQKFSSKSTVVVPPTDALHYDIIPTERDNDNNIIKDYIREKVNDPNCAIILYENPPYSEAGGLTLKDAGKGVTWKNTFVVKEMKKEVKGVVSNDLANVFIWSAFKYYLTKPFDSYIVYAPIKYWKQHYLVNKELIDTFICNQKHFHAKEGAILCCHWSNIDKTFEQFNAPIYDIVKNTDLDKDDREFVVKRVYYRFSSNIDTNTYNDTKDGIIYQRDGKEFNKSNVQVRVQPIENENINGYLTVAGSDLDPIKVNLINNNNNNNGSRIRDLPIKKVYKTLSNNYDKNKYEGDIDSGGLICESNGLEYDKDKKRGKQQDREGKVLVKGKEGKNVVGNLVAGRFDPDIKHYQLATGEVFSNQGVNIRDNSISYLDSHSLVIDPNTSNLTTGMLFRRHGVNIRDIILSELKEGEEAGFVYLLDKIDNTDDIVGYYDNLNFYMRKHHYIEKLPMFCASIAQPFLKWYEKGTICKTYDGEGSYKQDLKFLKRCFIYTILSFNNKCRSLWSRAGKLYLNKLCFEKGTPAFRDLRNFILDDNERLLLKVYYKILNKAKTCEEYKKEYLYGTYQIHDEINLSITEKDSKGRKLIYKKYPDLNSDIEALKKLLKEYYLKYIYDDLYKYELLK